MTLFTCSAHIAYIQKPCLHISGYAGNLNWYTHLWNDCVAICLQIKLPTAVKSCIHIDKFPFRSQFTSTQAWPVDFLFNCEVFPNEDRPERGAGAGKDRFHCEYDAEGPGYHSQCAHNFLVPPICPNMTLQELVKPHAGNRALIY